MVPFRLAALRYAATSHLAPRLVIDIAPARQCQAASRVRITLHIYFQFAIELLLWGMAGCASGGRRRSSETSGQEGADAVLNLTVRRTYVSAASST